MSAVGKVSILDARGNPMEVEIRPTIYSEANRANLDVATYLNRQFGAQTDVARYGTPAAQVMAACGLVVPDRTQPNPYGLRAPTMQDVLEGRAGALVASNTSDFGAPRGQASRTLFPMAVVAYMEAALVKDYSGDAAVFDQMVAQDFSVATPSFEQPIVNYDRKDGPHEARAQRRAQLALPPAMLKVTTSDKIRKIPSYAIGMEFSKEALRASTLDLVALTMNRYLQVERDSWVYSYISDLLNGDNDINESSLSTLGYAVNSGALDSAATTTITQKAWLKFLYRRRKYRRIDWVICDLDTYLLIEGRTGRPSLTAIDNTLPRLDPHATVINNPMGNVKVFLVDSAAEGGPLPANTILGLDSRYAIARVRNTSASYEAAESYALRQAEAFSIESGEICYRLFPEAFDVMTVAAA